MSQLLLQVARAGRGEHPAPCRPDRISLLLWRWFGPVRAPQPGDIR